MHRLSAWIRRWRSGGVVCALSIYAGCVPAPASDDSSFLEEVLAAPAPRPPAASTYRERENNDDYLNAEPVTIDGAVNLQGTISANTLDRDFYELGPGAAGDRITADLTIPSSIDAVVGILDENGELIGLLDLSSLSAGPQTMDIFLHEPTSRLYTVVAARAVSGAERAYTAALTLERGAGLPADRPQVVVLNFSGAANVRIAGRGAMNIPPFDAARISPRFAGQTSTIVQTVAAMVREAFQGVALEIHVAGEFTAPAGPRTTVYFGSYDSQLLGLADNIDPYNTDPQQNAIVYTDTFALFDVLSPDVEAIAQVLANTAAHEIGHLVGLRHTADPHDIMDTTATARQMMVPQWFGAATLNQSVMPVGLQNAPSLLSWTLGGQLAAPQNAKNLAGRQKAVAAASGDYDFYIARCPETLHLESR